jgi:hypothetical protein
MGRAMGRAVVVLVLLCGSRMIAQEPKLIRTLFRPCRQLAVQRVAASSEDMGQFDRLHDRGLPTEKRLEFVN